MVVLALASVPVILFHPGDSGPPACRLESAPGTEPVSARNTGSCCKIFRCYHPFSQGQRFSQELGGQGVWLGSQELGSQELGSQGVWPRSQELGVVGLARDQEQGYGRSQDSGCPPSQQGWVPPAPRRTLPRPRTLPSIPSMGSR